MFYTHDQTMQAFFDTLSFPERQFAVARSAGADIEEIARWLGEDQMTIAQREANVVSMYHAYIHAD